MWYAAIVVILPRSEVIDFFFKKTKWMMDWNHVLRDPNRELRICECKYVCKCVCMGKHKHEPTFIPRNTLKMS